MSLKTGQELSRPHVTVLPMTESAIKAVEAMAAREGMPTGLKVHTKSGKILYDSALTAGVELPHQTKTDQENHGYEEDGYGYDEDDYEDD